MAYLKIHPERITDPQALIQLCPFGAIELENGQWSIGAGCKMCRICVRKGGGAVEFVEEAVPGVDKSQWTGVAVVSEQVGDRIHPVTFELLGKARELAGKIAQPVIGVLIGHRVEALAHELLEYGANEVYVYDEPELENFRIEPYTAALEDFIRFRRPAVVLVGGTVTGRALAPRTAARIGTGLTADCTSLDIQPNTDLDQIRPAYGGNIMAHINTPNHRPQFATVRYKIFPIPPKVEPRGTVERRRLDAAALRSKITIRALREKARETGIEEAEVIVAVGRGFKKPEDLALAERLAELLGGRVAGTRAAVEAGWVDPKRQIGLSGRTVKPKLIVTCGISGAVQFAAGMNGAEKIVAINTDPNAPIFKVAHIGLVGDLYRILPRLIERIEQEKGR